MDNDELKAYFETRFDQMSLEIAELRRQVAQLGGCPPAPSATGGNSSGLFESLEKEAPAELLSVLRPTLKNLKQGLQLTEKHRAQLVIELVELCEESRRSADLSHPFYDNLEDRLQQLTSGVGLEAIQPGPGDAYRAAEHLILRTVRGEGSRDTVERCLKRGFRFQGQLLKKAEVSVFL